MCGYLYTHKWSFGKVGKDFRDKLSPDNRGKHAMVVSLLGGEHKQKLSNVKIESKDFREVMKENNTKDTLVYLDPPYDGIHNLYKKEGVTPEEVCKAAKEHKGKVLISYNDTPRVRKAAKKYGLQIEKIKHEYTFGRQDKGQEEVYELLISNYDTKAVRRENRKAVANSKGLIKRRDPPLKPKPEPRSEPEWREPPTPCKHYLIKHPDGSYHRAKATHPIKMVDLKRWYADCTVYELKQNRWVKLFGSGAKQLKKDKIVSGLDATGKVVSDLATRASASKSYAYQVLKKSRKAKIAGRRDLRYRN